MKKLCVYAIIIVALAACAKTNEEAESLKSTTSTGVTPASCDTVNMKYSANVLPILQVNCYSCHGNGQAEAGVSLDNYVSLKQQVSNTNLLNVITHASGYVPMPYNLPKLADCDINKIRDWIQRGALNN